MSEAEALQSHLDETNSSISALESELVALRAPRCQLVTDGKIFEADTINRTVVRPKEQILRQLYMTKHAMEQHLEDLQNKPGE
jgi:hypothetical protein